MISKEFKVGDWVRYKGITKIHNITHTGYHLSNGYITAGDNEEMELWKPQVDEFVWCVWIDKYDEQHRELLKWNERMNITDFDICEPFIGTLPTSIKENIR